MWNIPDDRKLIHTGRGADVGCWELNVIQSLVPSFRERLKIAIRKSYTKLIKYLDLEKESQQITKLKKVTDTTNITKSIKIT